MNLFYEYQSVMTKEVKLQSKLSRKSDTKVSNDIVPPEEMYGVVMQLSEISRSSLVPRIFLTNYNVSSTTRVFESVAAHTNLLRVITDRYLTYRYGGDFGEPNGVSQTIDGFSYRQIMEAISMHDLPENDIGDLPDDGTRDFKEKEQLEIRYFNKFIDNHPTYERDTFYQKVKMLLLAMNNSSSPTGKILHAADKAAAIFTVLTYDAIGAPPMMSHDSPQASTDNHEEMSLCDKDVNGYYYASEMWTIDFLNIRKFVDLDDTNFILGIIVMYTLMIKGHWYNWREQNYIDI